MTLPILASHRPIDQTGTALATSSNFAFGEVEAMAKHLAASGLLPGVDNPATAFSLMMLCQSQGLHPFEALRRFHIVEGRPAMRSDAMQAEFQSRGGIVRVLRKDADEARAFVAHPVLLPDGFTFSYTYAEAKAAGITAGKFGEKANWRASRPDMLWARCVTKAIRTVYPGIVAGIYSTAEAEDVATLESPAGIVHQQRAEAAEVVAAAEVQLPGQETPGHDPRPYVAIAAAAAAAFEVPAWEVHAHLAQEAIRLGKITGLLGKRTAAIKALTDLYRTDRDWIREQIAAWGRTRHAATASIVAEAEPAAAAPTERADYDDSPEPDEEDVPY